MTKHDSGMEAFVWNTAATLEANLKAAQTFIDRMAERPQKVAAQGLQADSLAEGFLMRLGLLIKQYSLDAQVSISQGQPLVLAEQEFIARFVELFKKNEACFAENLSLYELTEQQLLEPKTFLKKYYEFAADSIYIRLGIDVDFENFYTHGIYELEVGTFLLVSAHGDWEHEVYFYIYLDADGKPCTYLPKDGNYWNHEEKCAHNEAETSDGQYSVKDMQNELITFFRTQTNV
jgi:hypothetical protein